MHSLMDFLREGFNFPDFALNGGSVNLLSSRLRLIAARVIANCTKDLYLCAYFTYYLWGCVFYLMFLYGIIFKEQKIQNIFKTPFSWVARTGKRAITRLIIRVRPKRIK